MSALLDTASPRPSGCAPSGRRCQTSCFNFRMPGALDVFEPLSLVSSGGSSAFTWGFALAAPITERRADGRLDCDVMGVTTAMASPPLLVFVYYWLLPMSLSMTP